MTALHILHAHYDALNWGEQDTVARDLIAPGFVWTDRATGERFHCADGYRTYLRRWQAALPDLWLEVESYGGSAAVATCQYWLRGTHCGPLTVAGARVPGSGHALALAMCDVFHVCGGQLAALDTYYDLAAMQQQLQPTSALPHFASLIALN